MAIYHSAPELGIPPAPHTLTASAQRARDDFNAWAAANPVALVDGKPKRVPRVEVAEEELVSHHVPPWRTESGMLLTGAPRLFYNAALASGADVTVLVAGPAVEVRVDAGRIRAWWMNGRSTGAVYGTRKKVTVAVATAALNMTLEDAERSVADARDAAARRRAEKNAEA